MTSCPICQKPVDPIRASHIRVISGRVVPYCSAACRDADAARAAGPLSVPAPPTSAPSPTGAAVVSSPVGDAKSSAAVAAKAASTAKPDAKNDAKNDAKTAQPEAKNETKSDAKTETKNEAKSETKPGAKNDAKADAKNDAKADAKNETKADAKPSKADPKAAKPDAKAEAKPDEKPKSTDKGKGEPSTLKADKPDAAKSQDKASKPADRSGKSEKSDQSDKAKPATDKRDEGKPATAVEPAAPVRNADEERDATIVPLEPKRRTGLIVVVLVVLAVGGVLVWQATRSEKPAPAAPAPKPAAALPPPPPPPPPTFDPAQANARAVEVLRAHLAVESPRVRRFAGAALGRLGDAQAVQTLLDLLPTEQMEIARLDIAHGLARAGNAKGLEMLVNGLRSSRRDVKSDAARLLVALKDARAETTLTSLLVLSQFRLGAAEQLARLGNKQAITLLQKLRADDKTPEEDRLRATIALGYAGQPEVAEALRALLPDSRFNVGAAGALAVLRDASARQTLVEQLSIPSLRTSAALSLRRLEPELDASKLLYRVMPDLESSKDTERIDAAEAVLLLTGPATLAERD